MRALAIIIPLSSACSSERATPLDAPDWGSVTVHWMFVDHTGAPQPCPDTNATVELVIVYVRSGSSFSAGTYPCSAGQATTARYGSPRDSAGVGISVRRGDGSLFAAPFPYMLAPDVTITVTTDQGRLAAPYQFMRNGQALHCIDLGFPLVRATFTPPSGPPTAREKDCIDGDKIISDYIESGVPMTVEVVSANAGSSVANVVVPPGQLTVDAPILTLDVP